MRARGEATEDEKATLDNLGRDVCGLVISNYGLSLQDLGRLAQCSRNLRKSVYNHSTLFSRADGSSVSMKYEEARVHLDRAYRIREEIKLLRQSISYIERAIILTDKIPMRTTHFLVPSLGLPLIAALANAVLTPFKAGNVYHSLASEFDRVKMYFPCQALARFFLKEEYFSLSAFGHALSMLCSQTTLSLLGADEWLLQLFAFTQMALPTLLHLANIDADKSIQSFLQFSCFAAAGIGSQCAVMGYMMQSLFFSTTNINRSDTFASFFSWGSICGTAACVYGATYSLVNYFFKSDATQKNDAVERRVKELQLELKENSFSHAVREFSRMK